MSINFSNAADRINLLRGATRDVVVKEALSQTRLNKADADAISSAATLEEVEGILGSKGTSISELLEASSQLLADDIVAARETGRPVASSSQSE